MAKQAISDGGRVLWASPEMPDATRFSQIFSEISLTESSRFHAMNLVGNVDQALDSLKKRRPLCQTFLWLFWMITAPSLVKYQAI